MRILISLTLSLLVLASPAFAAQPSVRVAYLIPSDIFPLTQTNINIFIQTQVDKHNIAKAMTESLNFYAKEMEQYDGKTFRIERDDNDHIVINDIKGSLPLKDYKNLVSNGEFRSIALEVSEELDSMKGDDEITVIFIAYMKSLTETSIATTYTLHPEQGNKLEHADFTCYHYCFIPVLSEKLSYITAHELAHGFWLEHARSRKYLMYKDAKKKSLYDTILSEHERHWLHCHRFFNDQDFDEDKSVPSITGIHIPDRFFRRRRSEFRFDIDNTFPIHQAYLLIPRNGDGNHEVVAYDLNPRKSSVTFDVMTPHLTGSEKVRVSLLDERGNYVHYNISIDSADTRAAPSMTVPRILTTTWGELKKAN